jgi:hypothetical protein
MTNNIDIDPGIQVVAFDHACSVTPIRFLWFKPRWILRGDAAYYATEFAKTVVSPCILFSDDADKRSFEEQHPYIRAEIVPVDRRAAWCHRYGARIVYSFNDKDTSWLEAVLSHYTEADQA